MTEGKYQDLFVAIRAHRDALAQHAGKIAGIAARVREASVGLDDVAEQLETSSRELAHGLERLTRIADATMDETREMSIDDIA